VTLKELNQQTKIKKEKVVEAEVVIEEGTETEVANMMTEDLIKNPAINQRTKKDQRKEDSPHRIFPVKKNPKPDNSNEKKSDN